MGECATLPSSFNLHFSRGYAKGSFIKTQNLVSRKNSKNCGFASGRVTNSKCRALSLSRAYGPSTVSRGFSSKCNCSGIMIDVESAAASDWVPLIDQVLLTASVLLTYVAGVVPSGKSLISSQKDSSSNILLHESPVFFGSATEKEDQTSDQWIWGTVRRKITDSILAAENGIITKSMFDELDLARPNRPLSLYAVAHNSRLRLLLSSVEQLEKELNEIPDMSDIMEREDWLGLFSTTITDACRAAFTSWIYKEFDTEKCKPDKELLFSMLDKLKGDEIILGNIRKSGKMELYADMSGFLRYGCFRDYSYYDHNVYSLHGAAVLEDLVITIADAIASTYLEVISVDSDISEKISNLGLSLCALSTRALQKLRNEVAMCDWIHQNFGEIVLMYEDRFDLRVLNTEPCNESTDKRKESCSWWSKFTLKNAVDVNSSLQYVVVSPFSLFVKRTRELRALKGWRYVFSLLLELADIALPMGKAVVAQVRNAISFFLVSLIGRSVGLVYTGIRQSLRWK